MSNKAASYPMKRFEFSKYCATGNDFIVVDNRQDEFNPAQVDFWAKLCARKTGIGADGVLFLEAATGVQDYHMRYLNADGNEVEMCGNGARALAHFANAVGIRPKNNRQNLMFSTQNGVYQAKLEAHVVGVEMTEIGGKNKVQAQDLFSANACQYWEVGVPHVIYFVGDGLAKLEIEKLAPPIRHDVRFAKGCNVNFAQVLTPGSIALRTFERGVEGETLACGTGATAAALSYRDQFQWNASVKVAMPGGELRIDFTDSGTAWLWGAADKVYSGVWESQA